MKVEIKNGTVNVNGMKFGECFQEFKNGYHPAVKLSFVSGKKAIWFELDEPDLINKIKAKVKKAYL